MKQIHKIGAIILSNKRILVGKKKDKFIIPGGRIEGEESHEECLKRELKEEFNVEMLSHQYFGTFEDAAEFEPNTKIIIDAYLVSVMGKPKASGEIEEALYVNSKNKSNVKLGSILEKFVIPELEKRGLIE